MENLKEEPTAHCHVVAVPFPGRGHVNALMNLCKQLVSLSQGNILITYVMTEEWIGRIGSDPKTENIRFGTIPNVIPSEQSSSKDFVKFVDAVSTELEAPFEQLLDRLEPPVTTIVADTYLVWAVGVGNRRNIPVASFWTMSASVFSVIYHFDLFVQNGHYPVELSGMYMYIFSFSLFIYFSIPHRKGQHLAQSPSFEANSNFLN